MPLLQKKTGPSATVNRGVIEATNLQIRPKPEDFSSEGMNFGYVVFEVLEGAESMGIWQPFPTLLAIIGGHKLIPRWAILPPAHPHPREIMGCHL